MEAATALQAGGLPISPDGRTLIRSSKNHSLSLSKAEIVCYLRGKKNRCYSAMIAGAGAHASFGSPVVPDVLECSSFAEDSHNPMVSAVEMRRQREEEDDDVLREECGVVGIFGDDEASPVVPDVLECSSLAEDSHNPMVSAVEMRRQREEEDDDVLREECGVVGIFGDDEASRLSYLALHALQHRGQEGAGIVAAHKGTLKGVTGIGLVSDVFNETKLSQLPGKSAIGHVRYATAGASEARNVQPFTAGYRFGSVAVAHNGNMVNYKLLRAALEDQGSIFNTSSDTEVVLHLIATSTARPFISRLVDACERLEGAYSFVFLTEDKIVAVRDPHGFRPLVMGRRSNGAIVFASETCALDLIEATYEREVNAGEVIVVDADGISSLCLLPHKQQKACIFEHIYFSLPSSIVFGRSVYESRYKFGQILAEEAPADCDVVIAVPDSGVVAALGYAAQAQRPFQQGLIRSHYVGRTFIEPSQKIRDFGVKLKLAPVRGVLEGKKVVVVDDSIVRGTTSSKIVRLIKDAGAKEVHMRIASPPIIGSCYYGVDTPSTEELISHKLSIEETRKFIGADSLAFLPLTRLRGMLGEDAPSFCDACFSGVYAVPPRDLLAEQGNPHPEAIDLPKNLNGIPVLTPPDFPQRQPAHLS